MAKINRNPAAAAEKEIYDLIIIGGGIYGAMLALEATRRGLHSLLIEQGDFGEFTSFNSLRIIHGGFRYIQNMDIHRLRESVGELCWFLKTFPNLVKPLHCLMPLYGNGLRRPFILYFALLVYELLSHKSKIDFGINHYIPPGQVIDIAQTRKIFPSVDTENLQGGAIWVDGFMQDSHRLIIEILKLACEYGATTLNYVSAIELIKTNNKVAGVMAIDCESSKYHEFKAKIVVNACGPWCRDVAARFDRDEPTLFKSMMVWNVLFNRKALSDHGLAVTPKKTGDQTYFLVPWKGMLLAGTGHAVWVSDKKEPRPSTEQLQKFIDDINSAIPALAVNRDDILRIFAGLQPATKVGGTKLSSREIILNHADEGGPMGLFSVSGVKFTTARLVAEKTLNRIYPQRKILWTINDKLSLDLHNEKGIFPFDWYPFSDDIKWKETLRTIISEESVLHLEDLIIRRTSLGDNPLRGLKIASLLRDLFDWSEQQFAEEMTRLKEKLVII